MTKVVDMSRVEGRLRPRLQSAEKSFGSTGQWPGPDEGRQLMYLAAIVALLVMCHFSARPPPILHLLQFGTV